MKPPTLVARGLFDRRRETCSSLEDPLFLSALRDACETWGVFHLIHHGFNQDILDDAVGAMKEFFSLETSEKEKVQRQHDNPSGWSNAELTKQSLDLKEILDICFIPHRDVPDDDPRNRGIDGWNVFYNKHIREKLLRYYDDVVFGSFRLLEAFCRAFKLNYTDVCTSLFEDGIGFYRLNFYREKSYYMNNTIDNDGLVYGIHPHTDAGFFTVLWTSNVEGIEFDHHGVYVPVSNPMDNCFTINVGDMCEVLTNRLAKAPIHRVIIKDMTTPRYSMAVFFNPGPRAVIGPSPVCVQDSGEKRPLFKDISWLEFRTRRFQGDYSDTGKEVQISDYLTGLDM